MNKKNKIIDKHQGYSRDIGKMLILVNKFEQIIFRNINFTMLRIHIYAERFSSESFFNENF